MCTDSPIAVIKGLTQVDIIVIAVMVVVGVLVLASSCILCILIGEAKKKPDSLKSSLLRNGDVNMSSAKQWYPEYRSYQRNGSIP